MVVSNMFLLKYTNYSGAIVDNHALTLLLFIALCAIIAMAIGNDSTPT